MSDTSALGPALAYAARGWLVMPAHTLRLDGSCTCKAPGCSSPGKHPTLKAGVADASREPDVVRRWFESWPIANVAIVTGKVSGLFVVDASSGLDSDTASPSYEWDQLRERNGDRDDEATAYGDGFRVRTGSGSLHTYYANPTGIELPNTEGVVGPGISTRGEGGYVIAPPSKHRSGSLYRVDPLVLVPDRLPPLPEWLVDLVLQRKPRRVTKSGKTESVTQPDLTGRESYEFKTNTARAEAEGPPVDEAPPPTDADLAPVVSMRTGTAIELDEAIERAEQQQAVPKAKRWRPLVSRSPLALLQILSDRRARKAITGTDKPIRLNEITQEIYVGDSPMLTSTPQEVRIEIEREFPGDKVGGGLRFSLADVEATLRLIAEKSPFNPVREYLQALPKWNGEPGIANAVEEILDAPRTAINIAMLRRWMISAVARALRPGCKVDSMLVLTGPQGAKKSTFFEQLAGPEFYINTTVDIRSKDADAMMHTAWIIEWAELKSITRAQDDEAVKAFITRAVDVYRAPYGRVQQRYPRSCVLAGTSNLEEILTDATGGRRFWPIKTGELIDIDALKRCRDQLWAEAMAAYASEGVWWLTAEESAELGATQADHERTDAWEPVVVEWLNGSVRDAYTMADLIRGALDKPAGQWTRADEMRVADILKRNGWSKRKGERIRMWHRPKP